MKTQWTIRKNSIHRIKIDKIDQKTIKNKHKRQTIKLSQK
ncbi:hypothetical protein [Escherichia phage phi456]|uniref:Uncharacterized protein n=1 Tax=Escherichia phage phi456 TaxID=3075925 RepID=A0AA96ERF8_9CAUD|nr:hypothetical protein JL22_gp017 [Escherichia phage JL22]WKV18252.1 hypothetical protein [Escherichia coli]WLW34167.1 hypothetical protein [Escherichia coli]WLW34890.1 hypothetical protein [Escherichia coli]WNL49356.1 hypothetical protein [Escherichia phage phi456]